jgi:radical SAM protein with 4Fe4S-binding SPASM domain
MSLPLRHLTIKPLATCGNRCGYCAGRRELLRAAQERPLAIEQWAEVFTQASALGTVYLDISGGEPSLYPHLHALIWEAKSHGWFVSISSNGQRLNRDRLGQLAAVCLDQIILSLVSLNQRVHDELRGRPGSWQEAMAAITAVRGSPIRLVLHFILARQNYRELPALLDAAFGWGVSAVCLAYPENDHEHRRLLLDVDDIAELRQSVLPQAMERLAARGDAGRPAASTLASLFGAHSATGDFSQGRYFLSMDAARAACDKPDSFALIYPNGDVLPCNGLEYTAGPPVGNVTERTLSAIWDGIEYRRFRDARSAHCPHCPSRRHLGIPVSYTDTPPYASQAVLAIPDAFPVTRPDLVTAGQRPVAPVVFVTDWWAPKIGGLERSLEYLSGTLARRGLDISIMTTGEAGSECPSEDVPVLRFRSTAERSYYADVAAALRQRTGPLVVHFLGFSFFWPREQMALMSELAARPQVRMVLKVPTLGDATRELRGTFEGAQHLVSVYIALSDAIAAEIEGLGVSRDKIGRLTNGVPSNRFFPPSASLRATARRRFGLPEDRPVLGFAGRFVRRKRADLLIASVAGLAVPRRPCLALIGTPDATFGDAFDPTPFCGADVRWIPMQRDVREAYSALDAYVSASEAEGMPNAVLEALSMGLPIIATDIPGHRELVSHGVNGFLFPPGDSEGLQRALLDFVSLDDGTRAELSSASRRRAVVDFEERKIADAYIGLYRRMTESTVGGRG